ncbi:MAG: flavin reductase [Eubacterium sp.]|nr:flavin reductase [Eubacterium sp.]MDD7209223.1 flavin reductase [Lachnospiraceae bacterium]MDY5497951.1 flavin reductase [Anaerobutyricum sp.]
MNFREIDVTKEVINPFRQIGQEWMLLSAKKGDKVNTMTASWGTMGVFWGKNIVTVGIRPQRYTKEFVDAGEMFTLTFFDGERKKEMGYLGSVSGRDEDKIKKSGLHVTFTEEGEPTFEEGTMVLVCKKLMEVPLDPKDFKEDWIDEKWYPDKDYHQIYTAQIVAAYRMEA